MIPLEDLNQASAADFIAQTGGALEGEHWLAERVLKHRPFADVEAIMRAFETEIRAASESEKIRLLASHPDLGIKVDSTVSAASQQEQASAGLNRLNQAEYETFATLNEKYKATFGFPFVICARENTKDSILSAFQDRLQHDRPTEIETGIGEIIAIIRLRLLDLVAS